MIKKSDSRDTKRRGSIVERIFRKLTGLGQNARAGGPQAPD